MSDPTRRAATGPSFTRSVVTLLGSNYLGMVGGLLQGLVVAAKLGPSVLGAAGAVQSLNAIALNFADVRLGDLVARVYFQRPPGTPYRF